MPTQYTLVVLHMNHMGHLVENNENIVVRPFLNEFSRKNVINETKLEQDEARSPQPFRKLAEILSRFPGHLSAVWQPSRISFFQL